MEFIPIAEESGLISNIGDWVFEQVTSQTHNWLKTLYKHFQVSINMSPAQFRGDRTSHKHWLDHINALNLNTKSIVIEITEGLLMHMSSQVMAQLDSFDTAGIEISLDDFGTGYSSLSYLKKFHIDYLKIDQSFIQNLEADSDNMALCEAIIVLAHKLGLKVIAEGIETPKQRDLLIAVGCDYGQGYLFSKPLPPKDFEVFVRGNLKQH
jgi:EAL domain-containing protein (putative c-di-GMP-specific phosphodiesterase class I)